MLKLPTLLHRSSKPQTQVYLALHRIEFSLFTTAELYLVSVPLVLSVKDGGRMLSAMLLYGVRTFLLANSKATRRFTCIHLQKYSFRHELSNIICISDIITCVRDWNDSSRSEKNYKNISKKATLEALFAYLVFVCFGRRD